MTYHVARGGQTFGPYTEAEVHQYIASGNIGLSDLMQAGNSGEWVPVATLFPPEPAFATAAPMMGGGSTGLLYPAPRTFRGGRHCFWG